MYSVVLFFFNNRSEKVCKPMVDPLDTERIVWMDVRCRSVQKMRHGDLPVMVVFSDLQAIFSRNRMRGILLLRVRERIASTGPSTVAWMQELRFKNPEAFMGVTTGKRISSQRSVKSASFWSLNQPPKLQLVGGSKGYTCEHIFTRSRWCCANGLGMCYPVCLPGDGSA